MTVRCCCFFFQAEDGIRDLTVTGVQTCALPILSAALPARSAGDVALAAATIRPRDAGHAGRRTAGAGGRRASQLSGDEPVPPGHNQPAEVSRRHRRVSVLALRAPPEPRGPRRVAAPRRAVDDLPQRQLQRRRNRVPVPAAQYCAQGRLTAHRADGLHPYPSRQHAERRRQVHCHKLGPISPPRGGERSAGTSRLGRLRAVSLSQGVAGLHLPLSPGWLQTLLAIAALTSAAQSSGKPAGIGAVHFAPIAAAAGPASRYPWHAALSAALRTAAT